MTFSQHLPSLAHRSSPGYGYGGGKGSWGNQATADAPHSRPQELGLPEDSENQVELHPPVESIVLNLGRLFGGSDSIVGKPP